MRSGRRSRPGSAAQSKPHPPSQAASSLELSPCCPAWALRPQSPPRRRIKQPFFPGADTGGCGAVTPPREHAPRKLPPLSIILRHQTLPAGRVCRRHPGAAAPIHDRLRCRAFGDDAVSDGCGHGRRRIDDDPVIETGHQSVTDSSPWYTACSGHGFVSDGARIMAAMNASSGSMLASHMSHHWCRW